MSATRQEVYDKKPRAPALLGLPRVVIPTICRPDGYCGTVAKRNVVRDVGQDGRADFLYFRRGSRGGKLRCNTLY